MATSPTPVNTTGSVNRDGACVRGYARSPAVVWVDSMGGPFRARSLRVT